MLRHKLPKSLDHLKNDLKGQVMSYTIGFPRNVEPSKSPNTKLS
jgi:hypothetical protein